jgi:hypothetical protein
VLVGKPRIIKENNNSRVVFEIDVISTVKPNVVWLKDGNSIKDEGRYIVDVFDSQPNMYIIVLEIDNLTPNDSGKYKCTVANPKGDASTIIDFKLEGEEKKEEKKEPKKDEKKPDEKKVEEKKSEPAKRDSKAEAPKPEEKKAAEPTKRDSKTEPAKKDSKATETAASFKDKPKDQVGLDGDRITVTCKVIGSPKPEITWFKNNQPIKKSKVNILKLFTV